MSQLPNDCPANDKPLSDDFFSHKSLTLSVEIIGGNNPGLADAIKKAIDQISTTSCTGKDESQPKTHGEMYFNAQLLETLQAHTIGKIVSALTELGEEALHNKNLTADYLHTLRNLINDWVQLTEWVLKNAANYKSSLH